MVGSCAVGHSDKRDDSRPRNEPSIRRRRIAGPSWHSVRGIWHSHKKSVGHQSGVCELPRVRFSGAPSTATEGIEPGVLGRLDVREVRLRNGQMELPDYPNTLVGTFPVTRPGVTISRKIGSFSNNLLNRRNICT